MTTDPQTDFDGCNRECRKAGAHTLRWGGCERAPEPEPTVSMSMIYKDPEDGYPSIGFDSYTVAGLADLIEPALRRVHARIGPNALAMLHRGETVALSGGEYADLAREAAHAIVHRNDEQPPAVSVAAPPAGQADELEQEARRLRLMVDEYGIGASALTDKLKRVRDRHRDTCILATGKVRPTAFTCEMCEVLDAPAAAPPAPVDRAAVLREAADELDAHAAQLADTSDDPAAFVAKARTRAATEWRVAAALLRRLAEDATPVAPSAAPANEPVPSVATSRAPKAEALLLHFTAEAHRRKWSYDRGLDDDGVPVESEAFDALHRLGDEMNAALHKLRRLASETPGPETQGARCGCPHPADEHSVYGCVDGCGCEWMPKRPPMDPVRILGIKAEPEPRQSCACGQDGCEYCDVDEEDEEEPEIVHACPPDGSGLTPCCGRTPFELPLTDRISSEVPVTCTTPPAVVAEPGKEANTDPHCGSTHRFEHHGIARCERPPQHAAVHLGHTDDGTLCEWPVAVLPGKDPS